MGALTFRSRALPISSAIALYGFYCVPMPREVGVVYILVGALSMLSMGLVGITIRFSGAALVKKPLWKDEFYLAVSFLGIFYIAALGAIGKASLNDMVRDVIPHCFLYLGYFGGMVMSGQTERERRYVEWAVLAAAVSLMYRYVFGTVGGLSEIGAGHFGFDEFAHLSADPFVLFAALLSAGAMGVSLEKGVVFRLKSLFYLIIIILAFASFSAKLSRGPFALLFLCIFIFCVRAIYRSRSKVLAGFSVFILGSVIFVLIGASKDNILGVIDLLLEKQSRYGDSGKGLEFKAAVIQAKSSIAAFLFGGGWGQGLHNPFKGGADFTFTHNIFSYYLVKSGIVGVFLISIYVFRVYFVYCINVYKRRPDIAVAAGLTFTYCAMLQPTFKALSMGLILLLLRVEYLASFKADHNGRSSIA